MKFITSLIEVHNVFDGVHNVFKEVMNSMSEVIKKMNGIKTRLKKEGREQGLVWGEPVLFCSREKECGGKAVYQVFR
jgi:hypothetical protein